jgi:hypothetical protein
MTTKFREGTPRMNSTALAGKIITNIKETDTNTNTKNQTHTHAHGKTHAKNDGKTDAKADAKTDSKTCTDIASKSVINNDTLYDFYEY